MNDDRSIPRMSAHLRRPSDERRRRYEKLGLWHARSLGSFVDDQLAANSRSEVRFWTEGGYVGTCADIRRCGPHIAECSPFSLRPSEAVPFRGDQDVVSVCGDARESLARIVASE